MKYAVLPNLWKNVKVFVTNRNVGPFTGALFTLSVDIITRMQRFFSTFFMLAVRINKTR